MRLFTLLLLAFLAGPPVSAQNLDSSLGPLRVEAMATGLTEPWGLAFLPDGGFLVTERGGSLRHFRADGSHQRVAGVPGVFASGQGGLLDIAVAQDFASSRVVFVSYAARLGRAQGTVLARARLSGDGTRLQDVEELFRMATPSTGGRHFGGRIVEAPDGTLFLTLGERGDMDLAQVTGNHNGTIVRINPGGGAAGAGLAGALPDIWSYGHRNPQGAALDTRGQLWVAEHGARGGDEVNLIRRGANYGWPVIAYGRHYSGLKIGEGTHKAGMEQPDFYWDPSIAPSGLMIYSGRLWADWRGDFFVGSLKFDMISRLERKGGGLVEAERLQSRETARVRDIREAPDGTIWFLSVGKGAVYRISPTQ
ncbi:MAG: PQQ-dependent sugar dehydrogenase [Rhodobacteraceae bacterium]|nr:PQQ-dependent sugar dehydrogenase [Paracoccaceae bacterium]